MKIKLKIDNYHFGTYFNFSNADYVIDADETFLSFTIDNDTITKDIIKTSDLRFLKQIRIMNQIENKIEELNDELKEAKNRLKKELNRI